MNDALCSFHRRTDSRTDSRTDNPTGSPADSRADGPTDTGLSNQSLQLDLRLHRDGPDSGWWGEVRATGPNQRLSFPTLPALIAWIAWLDAQSQPSGGLR